MLNIWAYHGEAEHRGQNTGCWVGWDSLPGKGEAQHTCLEIHLKAHGGSLFPQAQPSIVWHMCDGFKLCVAFRGFQGCFQLALMCLLFLQGPCSAKDFFPLLSSVKGSVPYVLQTEMTEMIPSTLGTIFYHKNPHSSASSVCGNGSCTIRTTAKKSRTKPVCSGIIPLVENWWSAFLPGATGR